MGAADGAQNNQPLLQNYQTLASKGFTPPERSSGKEFPRISTHSPQVFIIRIVFEVAWRGPSLIPTANNCGNYGIATYEDHR